MYKTKLRNKRQFTRISTLHNVTPTNLTWSEEELMIQLFILWSIMEIKMLILMCSILIKIQLRARQSRTIIIFKSGQQYFLFYCYPKVISTKLRYNKAIITFRLVWPITLRCSLSKIYSVSQTHVRKDLKKKQVEKKITMNKNFRSSARQSCVLYFA